MKIMLRVLIVILGLVGISDASYITWEKFSGQIPPCNAYFKCGEVLTSPWSSIGPVPLSMLGMFFYSVFLILGVMLVLEKTEVTIGEKNIHIPKLAAIWGVIGGSFSLYLLYVMGVILNAWCLYCIISAIVSLSLMTITMIHYTIFERNQA